MASIGQKYGIQALGNGAYMFNGAVRGPVLPGPGKVIYVSTSNANTGDGRSWSTAFTTMAEALSLSNVDSGDIIMVTGKVREQLTAPAGIFDVTIIGAGTPRHGDAHTGDNGAQAAASWTPPASPAATTPLLTVRQQGWKFINILFDAPADDAALDFIRDAASGDSERDSSHAQVLGCRFVSGQEGIRITGTENVFNVRVEGCEFTDLTHAITSSAAYARRWKIINNFFESNTNHIESALTQCLIKDNVFGTFTTQSLDLTGGANNMVYRNAMSGDYDTAEGYIAGTNDTWVGNYAALTTGVASGAGGINVVPTS